MKLANKKFLVFFRVCGILWLLQISPILYSQDCKKLLNDYISEMSAFKQPVGTSVYFIHICISSNLWDNSKAKIPDVDARIYLTSNAYFYESNVLSMYKDQKDFIYLNHAQKQIIQTKGGYAEKEQINMMETMSKAQQELIMKGNISVCKDTVLNAVKCKVIELIPAREIEINNKIKKVIYHYYPDLKKIGKVKIEYTRQQAIRWQIIEYKELSFNYTKWKYTNANTIVFDNAGKVRSKYKAYSFTDNRK